MSMSCTKGDSSGLLQSLAAATASASMATAGANKNLSTTNWFTTEIQQMM